MRSVVFAAFVIPVLCMKDYTGHKLLAVKPATADQLEKLHALEADPSFDELDFWTSVSLSRPVDVRVAPQDLAKFLKFLRENNIEFEIVNHNLQKLIDDEAKEMARAQTGSRQKRSSHCDITTTFCKYEQIESFLQDKASNNPANANLSVIGTTHEGRNLYSLKIAADLNTPKNEVWVEVGTHAREWMAIAAGLNLITKLLDGSTNSSEMLAEYDWNIVPVHNPDGYSYSHTNDRLQRKNRQPGPKQCRRSDSHGIDLNRNWDFHFKGVGTSPNCRSDVYPGESAFEAAETAALRDAMAASGNVRAFFAIHSYSELLLLPYDHIDDAPPNYAELLAVGQSMAAALFTVRGTQYTVGRGPDILYAASGTSTGYQFNAGVPFTATYEVSPKTSSDGGFLLGPTFIPVVSQEVYVSLHDFVSHPV